MLGVSLGTAMAPPRIAPSAARRVVDASSASDMRMAEDLHAACQRHKINISLIKTIVCTRRFNNKKKDATAISNFMEINIATDTRGKPFERYFQSWSAMSKDNCGINLSADAIAQE